MQAKTIETRRTALRCQYQRTHPADSFGGSLIQTPQIQANPELVLDIPVILKKRASRLAFENLKSSGPPTAKNRSVRLVVSE